MCRLAAYLGPAISLQQFLIDPPHSLYRQSWEPRELKYARLNADGFGFGWYDPDGEPAKYTHSAPIWADANLPALARSLHNTLWIAEIRSATEGNPVHALNTAPFCADRRLFIHNGFISDFHHQVRPRMLQLLPPRLLRISAATRIPSTCSPVCDRFCWMTQTCSRRRRSGACSNRSPPWLAINQPC